MKTQNKITGLVLAAGCLLTMSVGVSADPDGHVIFSPRTANRMGPSQSVGGHFVWRIKAAPQGSVVQRASDGGRSWRDRTPPGFTHSAPDLNDGDVYPSSFGLSALDFRRCWVAFGSSLRGRYVIIVERTADGGQHWRRAVFPAGADSVVLQFLDARHGFLLALGGPAAGHMDKNFYRSNDGGRTWVQGGSPELVNDNYYPGGMAFRNTSEGWITGSNHGTAAVPLVQTRDGGRTWRLQPIPLPPSYPEAHGDASQPRFRGRSHQRGAFTVQLRNNSPEWAETVNYVTLDGGSHWHIAKPIRRKPR